MNNELENKIRELWQAESNLKGQIRAERYLPTKRKLQDEYGKLYVEIQKIQTQLNAEKEKDSRQKLNNLLLERRELICFTINLNRKSIPKNLEVELQFEPCSHKKKLQLPEVLRAFNHIENKFVPESNSNLLQRWERIFSDGESFSRTLFCEQCQKELAKSSFSKSNEVVGNVTVSVRMLQ